MPMHSNSSVSKSAVKSAYATFANVKAFVTKRGADITASERQTQAQKLVDVLPTIRESNPDDGKKVRRVIRKLGHYISKSGYDVKIDKANAKRKTRKAKVNADVTPNADVPDDANANADEANANA